MVNIAKAEAGDWLDEVPGDVKCAQKNPASSATGCFQILKGTWAAYQCTGDPWVREDNVACAQKIHARRGVLDWQESRSQWETP